MFTKGHYQLPTHQSMLLTQLNPSPHAPDTCPIPSSTLRTHHLNCKAPQMRHQQPLMTCCKRADCIRLQPQARNCSRTKELYCNCLTSQQRASFIPYHPMANPTPSTQRTTPAGFRYMCNAMY